MKNAGILGGIGPQATLSFYCRFIDVCQLKHSGIYPNLIINSIETWKNASLVGKPDKLLVHLKEEVDKIQHQVDVLAIVCNTMHSLITELREYARIPILAIHEEVAKEVDIAKCHKVGLLGTKSTLENEFYQSELDKYSISSVVLPDHYEDELDELVFKNVLYGKGFDQMRLKLSECALELEKQNVDGIILACTEFPLFITQDDVSVRLFSSTSILADNLVEYLFDV